MKRILRFLMLTVLFLPFALQAQNTLTVADGTTTNSNVPIYGLWADAYLRCQTIYPAAMLDAAATTYGMTGGSITSVTYYMSSPAAEAWTGTWEVKMMEVAATTLSAFVDMTNATTVYTGTLDGTTSPMTITFTTPYTYTGGNLLIEVSETTSGNYKSASFYGETVSGASWQGYNSNAWSSITGSAQNFMPKTTFTFTGGGEITCRPVQNLAIDATQTTSSSLTITWSDALNTGATYTIYDMADNSIIYSGITDNTYTVAGLDANTIYTFGVEANCSATDASSVLTVSGRTDCAALTNLPYTEDFENIPSGSYQMPYCWSRYTSAFTTSTTYPYSYSGNAHSGSRSLYFYGTTGDAYPDTMMAIMPELDVTMYPMSGNRVTFWAKMGTATNSKNIYVGTMTNPADPATFTLVDSILVSGNVHTKYSVPMTNATDAYVAFMVFKGTGSMYIDDVTLEEMPSCMEVTNLTVTGVTESSITLSWVDLLNPEGTNYTVYNMADTSDANATINGTVAVVENLDPNTVYTFGVQANCAAGDATFTTVSGRTACGIETMPWSENFDNWTSKSECWSFLSGALNSTPTANSSAWTLNSTYGNYINISGKALTMNLYSTLKYWAVTPIISITNDDAMLSVDVAVSAWSNATPNYDENDTLAFAISTDNGATYTILRVVNNTELNTLNGEYTTLYIPVTGYNGQNARFAIYGGSTSGTSPYDNRIAIDNVTVSEPINCMPVATLTASNIGSYGVTLNWVGNADSYTIYDMSDTTLIETAYDTTVVLTTLNPNTPYTLGVVANCSGEESFIRTVSFTTLVSCPAPTNLTATLTPGDGTVASLSWTEVGTATAWQICLNGDTNNLIDVYDNPHEFTNLTAEQAYTAQVRAYCDVDDQSEWSNTITFTPTNAYLITVNDGTTTNSYVPIYGYWADNITKSQFIIPATDLTAMLNGTINKLTFYASNANVSWGVATFNVYVTETSETTLSTLADYTGMTQVYAGSLSIIDNTMEVTFTNPYLYMGGNLMVGFLQTLEGSYSSSNWYGVSATGASMGGYGSSISQRDFLPKTTIYYTPGDGDICFPVTGLTADSATANSVFLSWSDNNNTGATYTIYDLSDTSVVASNISDLEYEVTGLTGSTGYTFGVVANCSASEESYMTTVNATTDCESGSCQITIVGLDSYGDGWNGAAIAIIQGGATIGSFTLTSGSNFTQTFNVCSGIPVSFSWTPGSYPGETSFEILNADNYTLYSASGSDLSNDIFLTINNACSSCLPASALTVGTTTFNSVTISWSGTADSYGVYNGETLVDNTTDTTYTFTNLTASTNYVFGVVANCSDGESSMMVTVDASTDCGIIDVFPYTQDFSATPACWTMIDADGDGYNWTIPSGYSAIQSASYDNTAGPLTPDNWLVSPQFAIPANSNYEVTWSATAQDQSWPAEHYGVYVSTTGNDTTNFTMIQEWTLTAGVFNPVIDLSSYAGENIYIALRHFNCTDQFRLSIDEFIVREQAGSNQVTINVTQNNPAYGTVSGAGIYNIGDSVTVSATANSGYTFSKWMDDNGNIITDNPYSFIAATDLTLNAIFLDATGTTYTITVLVNDSTMGTATGGGSYTAGDQITLSATANNGYHFVNWTQESSFGINVVGTDPDIIITVTGDKTFIANFEADSGTVTQYTVTLNTANATMGTVSPAGANTVNNGSSFTATATANAGYHFVAWMNGTTQVSTANPYTFTVNSNITLTATFEADPVTQYTVTLNTADATMGTVNPAGASTVNEGSSFTATATAADGFHFVAWMNGTAQVSTANPYTFTVTGNITLTATFEANDPGITYYEVTVTSADPNMGNVSSTASGSVAENTEVTVTATPAANYHFVNWIDRDGNVVSEANPYTFTVTADIALIATFAPNVGINDIDASNVMIYANNSTIYVRGAESHNIFVYDMNGRCIYQNASANETETISMSCAGIYLVRIDNAIFKKVVIVR